MSKKCKKCKSCGASIVMKKYTDFEVEIAKLIKQYGYKYLCRDGNDELYATCIENPTKSAYDPNNDITAYWELEDEAERFGSVFIQLFDSISIYDDAPTSLDYIIENKDICLNDAVR